jgi:hypothetical protein
MNVLSPVASVIGDWFAHNSVLNVAVCNCDPRANPVSGVSLGICGGSRGDH